MSASVHKLPQAQDTVQLHNPFLRTYLNYISDTESPFIYHLWSALAGIGACLGRRVYLPFGIKPMYANQYVVLVGPPGTRKSSALSWMKRPLKQATTIRFAPDDTAGQRQGLIMAMTGEKDASSRVNNVLDGIDLTGVSLDNVHAIQSRGADRNVMFAVSSEFGNFIGTNARELATFLIAVWDGDDYEYRTTTKQQVLRDPLMSILGATTPTDLSEALPPHSIGQGFTSRFILVWASDKRKSIPRPSNPDQDLVNEIAGYYRHAYYQLEGAMTETKEAQYRLNELYDYPLAIDDPRFTHYGQRRHTHLLKLCMCLAAARKSMEIDVQDVNEAHLILGATEKSMPEAFGEFGLNAVSAGKQRLIDFLRDAHGPVSAKLTRAIISRDLNPRDYTQAINDLITANKVKRLGQLNSDKEMFVFVEEKSHVRTVLENVCKGMNNE